METEENSQKWGSAETEDNEARLKQLKKRKRAEALQELAIQVEMEEFTKSIPGLCNQYKLVGKLGEGTFSSVYKAIDLEHYVYDNTGWFDPNYMACAKFKVRKSSNSDRVRESSSTSTLCNSKDDDTPSTDEYDVQVLPYVALKCIYVNSSPNRMINEIQLLKELSHSKYVARLITVMRHEDQVIVVMPHIVHDEWREYFSKLSWEDLSFYFRSLAKALRDIHACGIIHRDIKPSNFLYNVDKRKGWLVDFGLAERDTSSGKYDSREAWQERVQAVKDTVLKRMKTKGLTTGYWLNDKRPSARASRAGTRGFRAPEVLFKNTHQTCGLDIWCVGVILLCFLTKQFPFFNSNDDTEALCELACIFGKQKIVECAAMHKKMFYCNIPDIPKESIGWKQLVGKLNPHEVDSIPDCAFDFLDKCLQLDASLRITASEALEHPFLKRVKLGDEL